MSADIILQARGLKKYYGNGETEVHALDGVDLEIAEGMFVAVIGTSGSGKSTLLNMLEIGRASCRERVCLYV